MQQLRRRLRITNLYMNKLITIALIALAGIGMTPKANAWNMWWTWHYTFYGNHGTKTLMDGVMIAGYDAPGGTCQQVHTLNGGLTFNDSGLLCPSLKSPKFEVQLCDGGHPPTNCVTVATFTRDAVWRSACPACYSPDEHCGDQFHIVDYPVGVLNAPCFD